MVKPTRWQDRHESETGEASKPTIGTGNDEARLNEARDEPSREDETQGQETENRRRRDEARNRPRWDDMAPPRYRQGEDGGQGATSQPTPTDETGAESKHAVGNARDGKHGAKRGRDPMTTTETRPGKQEKTRHERKTQTAGETIANERKRESDGI